MGKNRSDIESSLMECEAVRQLTDHPGWRIIKDYCNRTIEANNRQWLFLPDGDPKLSLLRQEASRCYAMLSLVENFEVERRRLEELWLKDQLDSTHIAFDVDNETILKEED